MATSVENNPVEKVLAGKEVSDGDLSGRIVLALNAERGRDS